MSNRRAAAIGWGGALLVMIVLWCLIVRYTFR